MNNLRDDLRLAFRRLRQQPGFTAVAVLTLALGLGANIAIFTLAHALMLRSLPVPSPWELHRLGDNDDCCVNSGLADDYSLFSYPLFKHLRDQATEFQSLAAFQANRTPIGLRRSGANVGEAFPAQFVTADYFNMFGVRPAAGRLLAPDDDREDAAPAIVLSHRVWTQAYGQDPGVIGAAFLVNGRPMTVVGVAAANFFGDTVRPDPAGVWIPIGQEPALRGAASIRERADQNWLYAIGRIKPGVDRQAASSHLSGVLQQWLAAQPFVSETDRAALPRQQITVARAQGGVELMRIVFGRSITLLFVTSGLVLLIASANLANLLLARADRGQAAIRAALGASSPRLMRQSLTEGVVLALLGGTVGIFVAAGATRALLALAFPGMSLPVEATPSLTVIAFALGLSVITGAIFTAAPAWAMSRTPPLDALSGVGRSAHQRSFVPRHSLVVVQVAISVVLLTGAGLLGTSLGNLEDQRLGFTPEDRVVVRIDPPPVAGEPDKAAVFYARLLEQLERVPGVQRATYALYSPMEGNNWSSYIAIQGRPVDPAAPIYSSWNRVGPGFFETVNTPLKQGRLFDARDHQGTQAVAVVNEAFVRRFFDAGAPLGARLGIGDVSHAGDLEIVGVVEDVKFTAASQPVRPMIFLPARQLVNYESSADRNVQARSLLMRSVVVQVSPGAGTLEGLLRKAMAGVDPDVTVVGVTAMTTQVRFNFGRDRLMARLTSAYGVLALALAALGLYGVTAYGVVSRTREIGVRMALGAGRTQIVRTVLRAPLLQTVTGLAIGVPLALFASRSLAAMLYDVRPQDPWVLSATIGVLLASASVAAILPARRAASLNPTKALRGE